MEWLLAEFNTNVRVWMDDDVPAGLESITVAGKKYRLLDSGRFFEWLFDSEGRVVGVELCSGPEGDLFLALTRNSFAQNVEWEGGRARIWFFSNREGTQRCLQDWEDYYYGSTDGSLLIALRTHLLSPQEIEILQLSLGRANKLNGNSKSESDEA